MQVKDFIHPVRSVMEDHGIQSSLAAKACAMSASCFSSKLSGKLRWNAHEATAILTFLRWFDKGLTIEQLFPFTELGISGEDIQTLASEAKATARLRRMRRNERQALSGGVSARP